MTNKKFLGITSALLLIIVAQAIIIYGLYYDNTYIFSFPDETSEPYLAEIFEDRVAFIEEEIYQTPQPTEREQLDNISKSPKSVSDLFVTGWIPDWDIPDGLASIRAHVNNFDGISPVYWWVNSDGTLQTTSYTNNVSLNTFANQNNIELIPTITLFDADILSDILNNRTYFETHIDEIVNAVVRNRYIGIDIDYESIYLEDKELFFDFLEELSLELAREEKKLVFSVLPKWGDDVVYATLPQTRKSQDYKRIANLVDEFRIMSYEYSSRNSLQIGPIAPLAWMEDTIRYAILQGVPREKIVLGIHTYFYDHSERPLATQISYYPFYNPGGSDDIDEALGNYNQVIDELIAGTLNDSYSRLTVTFNREWGEAIGTYESEEAGIRTVVFPNQESIDLRKQLAADYGLKGVAYWRVGDEGSLNY